MVAEAMACGVPVVATDVGDCARIVGDAGIVVPPKNPQSMAEAWLQLAALPLAERKAMGAKARDRIAQRFNVDMLADKTLRAFRNQLRS